MWFCSGGEELSYRCVRNIPGRRVLRLCHVSLGSYSFPASGRGRYFLPIPTYRACLVIGCRLQVRGCQRVVLYRNANNGGRYSCWNCSWNLLDVRLQ